MCHNFLSETSFESASGFLLAVVLQKPSIKVVSRLSSNDKAFLLDLTPVDSQPTNPKARRSKGGCSILCSQSSADVMPPSWYQHELTFRRILSLGVVSIIARSVMNVLIRFDTKVCRLLRRFAVHRLAIVDNFAMRAVVNR